MLIQVESSRFFNEVQQTKVESRASSAVQLSSDLGMLPSTCQGRVCAKVTENRAKDFLAFLHECSLLLGRETYTAVFPGKFWNF